MQQCSAAKVKTKPALDGAEAEWAEVGAVTFLLPDRSRARCLLKELLGVTFTVRLCPQIQEGMVVYVCFLQGATDDIIHDMGESSLLFWLLLLSILSWQSQEKTTYSLDF